MWVFFAVVILTGDIEPTMFSYNNWEQMSERRCHVVEAVQLAAFADEPTGVMLQHGCAHLAAGFYDRHSA